MHSDMFLIDSKVFKCLGASLSGSKKEMDSPKAPLSSPLPWRVLSDLTCVSCGTADNRCYTPTSFRTKMAYRNPKTDVTRRASQKNLASEAYRAKEGAAHEMVLPIAYSNSVLTKWGFYEIV